MTQKNKTDKNLATLKSKVEASFCQTHNISAYLDLNTDGNIFSAQIAACCQNHANTVTPIFEKGLLKYDLECQQISNKDLTLN